MFRKQRPQEGVYAVPLQDLSHMQISQQILMTLERMEKLLVSIESKMGNYTNADLDKFATETANGINENTDRLSQISLTPGKPKNA